MRYKLKILMAVLLTVTIFTSYVEPVMAQTAEADLKCFQEMKPYITEKSTEFRTFLTGHFQNKSTNTSLLDLAIKRYDLYKRDLFTKFETYSHEPGSSILTQSADDIKCYNQITEEITMMEQVMRGYFEKTAKVKTTSAVMQKLKEINKKMDTLLKSVIQLLGKWKTLKGRVPCFIKSCI